MSFSKGSGWGGQSPQKCWEYAGKCFLKKKIEGCSKWSRVSNRKAGDVK